MREFVLGAQDGLLVPLGVVTGMAAAHPGRTLIVVAGLAEAVAGAVAMGSGSFLASEAEEKLYEAEIRDEGAEIADHPERETAELALILEREGLPRAQAEQVALGLAANPNVFLRTKVQKELGLSPDAGGAAFGDALVVGGTYLCAAIVPLWPYLLFPLHAALVVSLLCTLRALFALGVVKGRLARMAILLRGSRSRSSARSAPDSDSRSAGSSTPSPARASGEATSAEQRHRGLPRRATHRSTSPRARSWAPWSGGPRRRPGRRARLLHASLPNSWWGRSRSIAPRVRRPPSRPPSARRPLRMAATSITSCAIAPCSGAMPPNAATTIESGAEAHADEDPGSRHGERLSADLDRVGDTPEIVDEHDSICSIGGDRAPIRTQRNAHVSRRQRGSVVQTVSDHDDDLARASKLADDPRLVFGRRLGMHVGDTCRTRDLGRHGTCIACQE